MSVEFHDFITPADLPRIRACLARMEELGFVCLRFSLRTYGDVLFLNRALVRLGAWEIPWAIARFKFARGLARYARRLVARDGYAPGGYVVTK